MSKFESGDSKKTGEISAEAIARERERILADENRLIKVEADDKKWLKKHFWPLFVSASIFSAAEAGYLSSKEKNSVISIPTEAPVTPIPAKEPSPNVIKIPETSDLSERIRDVLRKDRESEELEQALTNLVPESVIKGIEQDVYLTAVEKKSPEAPVISGFEKISPEADKVFKLLFDERNHFYPKGWLNGKIKTIAYSAEPSPEIGERYGSAATNKSAGYFSPYERSVLVYTNDESDLKKGDLYSLNDTLGHEVGHANEWLCNGNLGLKARLVLLKKVTERLNASDRDKSAYVESLDARSGDKLEIKAEEYWAEICRDYFMYPLTMKETNPADYDLVEGVVRMTDPNFKPEVSSAATLAVLENIYGKDGDRIRLGGNEKSAAAPREAGGKDYTRKEYIDLVVRNLRDENSFLDKYGQKYYFNGNP